MNPWIHCDKNIQEPKTIPKDSERKDSTSSGREKERINCNCYGFIVIEAIVHCPGTPMKTGSWWKCRLLSVLSVFCMIVFGFFLVSFLFLWFYFSLYFAPHWFCHLKRKTTPIITISHGNNFWGLFNSIFALCVANSLGKLKLRRESGTKFRGVRIVVYALLGSSGQVCVLSLSFCACCFALSARLSANLLNKLKWAKMKCNFCCSCCISFLFFFFFFFLCSCV